MCSPAEFRQASGFDAIFCMAVFQYAGNRNAGTERVRGNLTFERFEQELTVLDRRLIPGGLLFLDNADFLFMDTVLSSRYEAVVFPGSSKRRRRPVFGRDNRKVAEESTAERCFRKRAAHGDTCSRNSSTLYT